MVVVKCPMCGSRDTIIYDAWYSDDGVRVDCEECNSRVYVKSFDDLDIIEVCSSKVRDINIRGKAYRRRLDKVKARRKLNLSNSLHDYTIERITGKEWSLYDNLHQYSKNKIHKRKRSRYKPDTPSISDIKRGKIVRIV